VTRVQTQVVRKAPVGREQHTGGDADGARTGLMVQNI
jgi:hypothetical protein